MRKIMKLKSLTAVFISFILSSCTAFRQSPSEVAIRSPGERVLGAPVPAMVEAKKHWQYAWLAEASYRDTAGVKSNLTPDCPPADEILKLHGWQRWENFPDDGLLKKISISNLRAEVWENPQAQLVVVSFGGTIFTSGKDWKSNLRWFMPKHKDEYTEIVDEFGPAFVAEYQRRLDLPEGEYLKAARLDAVGHSLGGGLAQQFAYSLPKNKIGLHVSHVFAFDPSPVTGFYSVPQEVRDANKTGLSIDRIYERGEVLAAVRSFTSFFVKPSDNDPIIRGIRYNLFYSPNVIKNHSMETLACKLQAIAKENDRN